jgi:hypothetical protein
MPAKKKRRRRKKKQISTLQLVQLIGGFIEIGLLVRKAIKYHRETKDPNNNDFDPS